MTSHRIHIRINPAAVAAGCLAISAVLIGCVPGPLPLIAPPEIPEWLLAGFCVAALGFGLRAVPKLANSPDHNDDRALQILRERYARGELEQEEFEQRLRDLARSSSASSARGERSS